MVTVDSASARGPWRASEDNTSGWYFMSPEERIEHQARIRSFKTYEECHAYQHEHHRLMENRAKEKGLQLNSGRRDICGHLLPPGASR
jgi:hypothetical protein